MAVEASGGPNLLCGSGFGDDGGVSLKQCALYETNQQHLEMRKLVSYEGSDDSDDGIDIPLSAGLLQNSNMRTSSSDFDGSIEKMPTTLPVKRLLDNINSSHSSVKKSKVSSYDDEDGDDDMPVSWIVKRSSVSADKPFSMMKKFIEKELALLEKTFEECQSKGQAEEQRLHSLRRDIEECTLELRNKKKQVGCIKKINEIYKKLQTKIEECACDFVAKETLHSLMEVLIRERRLELKTKEVELEILYQKIDQCTKELKTKEEEFDAIKKLFDGQAKELESERKKLLKVISTRNVHFAQMKDCESTKKRLEGRTKEVESIEKQLEDRVKGFNLEKEEFARQVKEVESKFGSQAKDLELERKQLEGQLKEIESKEKQLNGQEKELESKSKHFDGQVKELESIKNHFNDQAKELESKEKQLEGLFEKLELKEKQLKSQVKEFESKEEKIVEQVMYLKSKEKRLEGWSKELESKEKQFEDRVNDFELKEEEFESQVKELESKEKQFEDRVNDFELKEEEFESQVKELQSKERSLKQFEGQGKEPEFKEKQFQVQVRELKSKGKQFKGQVKDLESKQDEFNEQLKELELREKQYVVSVNSFKEETELDQLSPTIEGRSLQFLPSEKTDEPEPLENDILAHLKATSDPSQVVLDIILKPIIPRCMEGDNAVIIDSSHIFLLEQLMQISPHVEPHVREEAMRLALDLKAKMSANIENSLLVLCFLLLLSIYRLLPCFDRDEVFKLFEFTPHHKLTVELFRTLGFADKVSDFIQDLVKKQQYIEAVRFICAFKLADKNQPVDLLREYTQNAKDF